MGTKIIYNSAIIADLEGGQTATLKCKGLKMASDVTIEAAEGGGSGGGSAGESTGDSLAPLYGLSYECSTGTTVATVTYDKYATVTVPRNAIIHKIFGCNKIQQSTSGYQAGPTPYISVLSDSAYTVTTSGDLQTFKIGGTVGGSSKQYYETAVILFVLYKIPGIELRVDDNGEEVLYVASTAPALFKGLKPENDVAKIDLSDSGISEIPNSVFTNLKSVKTVVFPSGVKTIGSGAFSGCGITSVVIPEGVTSADNAFTACTSLTSAIVPSTLTEVTCFGGCSALTNIELPEGVLSIDFGGCSGLQTISLPSTLTTIQQNGFDGCTSLQRVKIPASVTSIGSAAFYKCTGMQELDLTECTTVPTCGANIFLQVTNVPPIKVPSSLYDAFVAASGWSTYASKIVAV